MANRRVRVSVANLAPYLKNQDTGDVVAIGITNKKRFEKGNGIFLEALGGAASVTPGSRLRLEEKYRAEFLGTGASINDARFIIPVCYLEEVLHLFGAAIPGSNYCEVLPLREAIEELEEETIGGVTVLKAGALATASSLFNGFFRQEISADGKCTSTTAASQDVETRRLFFVHTLVVPEGVFNEILLGLHVTVLSEEDLATTEMGRKKGTAESGYPMSGNLCNYLHGYIK